MKLIVSPLKTKKYRAVFSDGKTIDFGASGYDDFTITKDKAQRERYLNRHRAKENWNEPRSAGALSRWILWGQNTTIADNLRDFKVRFAGRL